MNVKDILANYLDQEILVMLDAHQLNLMGQTFRPIFIGPLTNVTDGFITLSPVTIKMLNAPEYNFPTPLRFPLERIVVFTPNFSSDTVFPLS
ncbi:hypothetical protein [Salirhabdus salicampi]|uniref:hypothetical protein n=1 Tax=Salirhabdus salicampi TaxID=476102 RepID=UPI0020C2463D|nr:hypothetical protein [Salirhabdus salicampi]MCP8615275.1 hypothetical protein [Salirhabdus salicampi]